MLFAIFILSITFMQQHIAASQAIARAGARIAWPVLRSQAGATLVPQTPAYGMALARTQFAVLPQPSARFLGPRFISYFAAAGMVPTRQEFMRRIIDGIDRQSTALAQEICTQNPVDITTTDVTPTVSEDWQSPQSRDVLQVVSSLGTQEAAIVRNDLERLHKIYDDINHALQVAKTKTAPVFFTSLTNNAASREIFDWNALAELWQNLSTLPLSQINASAIQLVRKQFGSLFSPIHLQRAAHFLNTGEAKEINNNEEFTRVSQAIMAFERLASDLSAKLSSSKHYQQANQVPLQELPSTLKKLITQQKQESLTAQKHINQLLALIDKQAQKAKANGYDVIYHACSIPIFALAALYSQLAAITDVMAIPTNFLILRNPKDPEQFTGSPEKITALLRANPQMTDTDEPMRSLVVAAATNLGSNLDNPGESPLHFWLKNHSYQNTHNLFSTVIQAYGLDPSIQQQIDDAIQQSGAVTGCLFQIQIKQEVTREIAYPSVAWGIPIYEKTPQQEGVLRHYFPVFNASAIQQLGDAYQSLGACSTTHFFNALRSTPQVYKDPKKLQMRLVMHEQHLRKPSSAVIMNQYAISQSGEDPLAPLRQKITIIVNKALQAKFEEDPEAFQGTPLYDLWKQSQTITA